MIRSKLDNDMGTRTVNDIIEPEYLVLRGALEVVVLELVGPVEPVGPLEPVELCFTASNRRIQRINDLIEGSIKR